MHRDREWLTILYRAARRKLEKSYLPVTAAGDDVPELTALAARERYEAGSPIAPILSETRKAFENLLLRDRESPQEAPTTAIELGALARSIKADLPLEGVKYEHIEAASLAFPGVLRTN